MLEAYRPSTAYKPLAYLSRNPVASDIMVTYLRNNVTEVLNSPYLREYLDAMTATWQTNTRLNQVDYANIWFFYILQCNFLAVKRCWSNMVQTRWNFNDQHLGCRYAGDLPKKANFKIAHWSSCKKSEVRWKFLCCLLRPKKLWVHLKEVIYSMR